MVILMLIPIFFNLWLPAMAYGERMIIRGSDSSRQINLTEQGREYIRSNNPFIKKNYPGRYLVETEYVAEGLILLSNGYVDAFVDHMAICLGYMQHMGIKNLKTGGMTEFIFYHCPDIDPEHSSAVAIVNKAIASISGEEHGRVYEKWINVVFQKPFDCTLFWQMLIALFFAVSVAALWNRKLARLNSKLNLEISGKTNVQERLKQTVGELRDANRKMLLEMDERIVSEKRFRDIADMLPQMIYECDSLGRITYTNRYGYAFSGCSEDDINRVKISDFLSPEDMARAASNIRSIMESGEPEDHEYSFIRKDGTEVPVLIYSSVIQRDGTYAGLRGVIIDISGRKRVEEAIVAANRAKSEFLANVSHEIRTPLNAIMGLASIVLGGRLSPEQRRYVDRINSSALSLLGIINDMLDFSKIEAGKLELEEIDFRLEDVLVNLAELISFNADEHEMEVLISVADDVPCLLRGDPLRLGQVLVNLTSNAIKFGSNRDALVSVSVDGGVPGEEGSVVLRFSVKDRGIGLTPEQIGRLFRPFVQADTSMTRRFGGTGLGLVICRQIVDLMNGTITVESVPGEGSTFSFTAKLGRTSAAVKADVPLKCDYSGVRVLVVDDSVDSCAIIRQCIEGMNALCVTVTDPAMAPSVAVDAVRRGVQFNVVMADYKMPVINGIECIKNIRNECGCAIRTVLMVNPNTREMIEENTGQGGVDMFLDRPVFASSVRNTLNELLKKEPAVLFEDLHPEKGESPANRALDELKRTPGLKALIVEDNRTNQLVLSKFVEKAGIKSSFAENGSQCVDEAEKDSYDIILMDIQMPVMDGYEASTELRRRGFTMPIIGVSAHAYTGERENCINAGMNDYISKPVSQQELYQKIYSLISRK